MPRAPEARIPGHWDNSSPSSRRGIEWSRESATDLRSGGRRVDAWETATGRRFSSWVVEVQGRRWMVVIDDASGEVD